MSPDTSLWAAVVMQAIVDATSNTMHGMRLEQVERVRSEARVWLTRPNPDFSAVCVSAGLNEEAVRAFAAREIAAFDQRRAAGQTRHRPGKRTFGLQAA